MPHTKLHEAIANAFAGTEEAVLGSIDGRADAIVLLLREPDQRDEDIWRDCFRAAKEAGGPLTEDDWDVDLDDLVVWPREDRGFHWAAIIQTAISAAQAQFDAEHILPGLWEACAAGGDEIERQSVSVPRPLSREARRGPGRATWDAAKQRRGAE